MPQKRLLCVTVTELPTVFFSFLSSAIPVILTIAKVYMKFQTLGHIFDYELVVKQTNNTQITLFFQLELLGSNLVALYKVIDKSMLPDEYLPDDHTGPSAGPIDKIIGKL